MEAVMTRYTSDQARRRKSEEIRRRHSNANKLKPLPKLDPNLFRFSPGPYKKDLFPEGLPPRHFTQWNLMVKNKFMKKFKRKEQNNIDPVTEKKFRKGARTVLHHDSYFPFCMSPDFEVGEIPDCEACYKNCSKLEIPLEETPFGICAKSVILTTPNSHDEIHKHDFNIRLRHAQNAFAKARRNLEKSSVIGSDFLESSFNMDEPYTEFWEEVGYSDAKES